MTLARRFVRFSSLALVSLWVSGSAFATEIPGTGGKLDFGMDGLDIPTPIFQNLTTPRTVELLANAAARQTAAFRRAQIVAEIGGTLLPEAIPVIDRFLSDPAAEVRASAAAAAKALAADGSLASASREALRSATATVAAIEKLFEDEDLNVQIAALEALVAIRGADTPQLMAALDSNEPRLLAIAFELAQTPAQGERIADRVDDVTPATRARAILAIGRTGAVSRQDVLVSLLRSDRVSDAVAAAQGLALLKQEATLAPLATATEARHPVLRREALRAHSAIAGNDARIALAVKRLSDPDPTVRQYAAEAMGTDLRPDLVAPLVEQLADPYRPLYRAARQALVSAQTDAAREASILAAGRLLDHADPRRQEDASYILGRYRSDHRLERHIELLVFGEGADYRVVGQAAESLGLIGRTECREPLVKLGKAHNQLRNTPIAPDAVAHAIVACGRLGFEEILPDAGRILASDPLTAHLGQKEASSFAVGMLSKPGNEVNRYLFSTLNSTMDANKFETVKAIGNLKLAEGLQAIQNFPMSDAPPTQFMIQWATARITGEPPKYTPMVLTWHASSSYRDTSSMP